MRIRISNFKSIDNVELELAPLTILLGPPASGKSNILDAIALTGYFNRLILVDQEYGNATSNLEPLTLISRFDDQKQLFRYHDLTKEIRIDIKISKESQLKLKIFFEKGKINVALNETSIPWDLKSLITSNIAQNLKTALTLVGRKNLAEARLYGYDRYGLAVPICTTAYNCGFHIYLRGEHTRDTPKHILSELGQNAHQLTKNIADLVLGLNNIILEKLGEKIEVKILRTGAIVVFDHDVEVEALTVSDSIFRVLYYLMALRTSSNYVKIHGLERKFALLLEEPEAHIFPFFLNILVEQIIKAMETSYVVITTHNPMLVSILWDKVNNVKTYYVTRDKNGSTRASELDIEKLAEDMRTSEDILFMSPSEVLEKYTVQKNYKY